MPGQVVRGLADQDHDDKVVEQLDRADRAFERLLPMRARRLPQPISKPRPPPLFSGHAMSVSGVPCHLCVRSLFHERGYSVRLGDVDRVTRINLGHG